MGRTINPLKARGIFDPKLAMLPGRSSQRYWNIDSRDAAHRIQLERLTKRIRTPVNMAGVQRIPDNAVIYGIYNTDICCKVSLETLTSRKGIASTIEPHCVKPNEKPNLQQLAKARKFAEMHAPFLESDHGPFEPPL
jgi:hypothetical protein